jgi:hypothetical protein
MTWPTKKILIHTLIVILFAIIATDIARAWGVKRVLSNAAHEAARVTVSTPLTSRTCPEPLPSAPCSIQSAADAAKQYLLKAGLEQASCLAPQTPSFSGVLVWAFACDGSTTCQTSNGAVCLEIDMKAFEAGRDGELIPSARVTLLYPHAWTFDGVVKLIPGGAKLRPPRSLAGSALMRE